MSLHGIVYDCTKIGVNYHKSTEQTIFFLYAIEPLCLCAVFITFGNSNYIFMKVLYMESIFSLHSYLVFHFTQSFRMGERKNKWRGIFWKDKTRRQGFWIHCAPSVNYEQGRPVIEAIKRECLSLRLCWHFFLPGYEIEEVIQRVVLVISCSTLHAANS